MRVRVITLAFSEALGGFPEGALQQALSGQEVLEVREHFFTQSGRAHLALVCLLGGEAAHGPRPMSPPGEDPSKDLSPEQQLLYRDVRRWRNERAKAEGIPNYLILRNRQIAEICRTLPRSLAALKEIEGLGEATCEKFGRDLLALIPAETDAPAAPPAPAAAP